MSQAVFPTAPLTSGLGAWTVQQMQNELGGFLHELSSLLSFLMVVRATIIHLVTAGLKS